MITTDFCLLCRKYNKFKVYSGCETTLFDIPLRVRKNGEREPVYYYILLTEKCVNISTISKYKNSNSTNIILSIFFSGLNFNHSRKGHFLKTCYQSVVSLGAPGPLGNVRLTVKK